MLSACFLQWGRRPMISRQLGGREFVSGSGSRVLSTGHQPIRAPHRASPIADRRSPIAMAKRHMPPRKQVPWGGCKCSSGANVAISGGIGELHRGSIHGARMLPLPFSKVHIQICTSKSALPNLHDGPRAGATVPASPSLPFPDFCHINPAWCRKKREVALLARNPCLENN